MIPGVLILVAAAVLAWLSVVDRVSPLAVQVVEWESAVHFPLWILLAVIGAALLANGLRPRPKPVAGRRQTVTRERQRRVQAEAEGPPAEGPPAEGWRSALDARARALSVEPQGRIKVDETVGVPYTLVLRNATPQQARTRFAAFAGLLSSMPTPPAARVRVESSPDIGGPIHKALAAELERFFPTDAFQVLSRSDGADVRFTRADPRWSEGA